MGYPNEAERRRLERFPDRIAVEDLRACFALSDRDRVVIFEQRGPENRLGLAVSLLPIVEHTTDTHGATELVFALFDLLGLRFIPRLRDAGDLLLYRLGAPTGLPVDAVLRARARPQRIREQYDDLLRTAASLKRGWVPASLLISRLKNATPQSPLAAALGDYGRIVRTNFLLVYCADPAERARIAGQLNKGETLHALRRHLVIGSRAQIPADEDDHHRHALCLQILVNAVQVWNARYMTASIDHLSATTPDVVADETAIARVAPVAHADVNSGSVATNTKRWISRG